MASNQLPDSNEDLFTLGEDMADGCHTHEAAIGLKQNKEADVRADLSAALVGQNGYKTALAAKGDFSTAVTVADSNAKSFIGTARRVLVTYLGDGWSQAWEGTGFPDQSTAVPGTQGKRQNLLQSLGNYFTTNPTQENAPLHITAVQSRTVFTALSNARSAAADGNNIAGQKKSVRDDAIAKLRRRLSGLISELGQLLDDNDPRWLAFGLNLPGASNLPDPVDGLVLTAGGAGVVLCHWSNASRATRYRVFKQVVSVDADFIAATTVSDSDYTFTNLPTGKTVNIRIVSANDAGEAQPSNPVQMVVP